MSANWLTSGWIDVVLTPAWFLLVIGIGVRVWERSGDG